MRGLLGGAVVVAIVALTAAPVASPAGSGDLQIPYAATLANTCTGEAVAVTGVLHVTLNAVAGDNAHSYAQTNWQDTRGVALVTGTPYQANDSNHLVVSDNSSGTTTYFQDEFELVSLGPTPNLLVHMRVGISFDKNGNPQPIMQGGADCSGRA
jgi:hypothetical protein